jgi:NAD dependent epimerase/dehydratase family enzyme
MLPPFRLGWADAGDGRQWMSWFTVGTDHIALTMIND